MKITKIRIKRYRSILDLTLCIKDNEEYITICGENNTGKTNTLRAIDLFFNPEKYIPSDDAPHHKYEGTRGGSVFPEISVTFKDKDKSYIITRNFKDPENIEVKGKIVRGADLSEKETQAILKKIVCFYIESINISFPNVIKLLVEDLYDIEYAGAQFRGLKGELKRSFEAYTQGLLNILKELAEDINPLFSNYKDGWGVGFDLSSDIKKFRDIITDDIEFYLNDKSNKNIEAKGSGLQRLGYLLLHFRIAEKIKNKKVILLIDEPDAFLHQGLQKKLRKDLINIANKHQVFITTHSNIFINSYKLSNTFLLELKIEERDYVRRNKKYNILSTSLVDITEIDGGRKIREYLVIETIDYDLLDSYNILVEGEADKKYLSELMSYFEFPIPNMISAGGAGKIKLQLDFYNNVYNGNAKKPTVRLIFDNDQAGRDAYKKIKESTYSNLNVIKQFIPNYLGEMPPENLDKCNMNYEIEDFIYPKIICEFVNKILAKGKYTGINVAEICKMIGQPSHKSAGILALIEYKKNEVNPTNGHNIIIASESFKAGLAGRFSVKGNDKLITILNEEKIKYPAVYEFLQTINKTN